MLTSSPTSNVSSNVSNSLAALKQATSSTSLATVLSIYAKATKECAIDRNLGFKHLVSYLAPIELPIKKYPTLRTEWLIPSLCTTWEAHDLAAILSQQETSFSEGAYNYGITQTRLWERAIFMVWYTEIVPSLLAKQEL